MALHAISKSIYQSKVNGWIIPLCHTGGRDESASGVMWKSPFSIYLFRHTAGEHVELHVYRKWNSVISMHWGPNANRGSCGQPFASCNMPSITVYASVESNTISIKGTCASGPLYSRSCRVDEFHQSFAPTSTSGTFSRKMPSHPDIVSANRFTSRCYPEAMLTMFVSVGVVHVAICPI